MSKLVRAAVVGLFCIAVTLYPAQAAQSGTAGIEFYEPSVSAPPGGGSSSGGTGGTSVADGNPAGRTDAAVEPLGDDLVWVVDPLVPLDGLMPLPATGSQNLPSAILILAGACLTAFSMLPGHLSER